MKTTKLSADTAVAQVVKLVQEAQNSMAGSAAADRAVFWLALVAVPWGSDKVCDQVVVITCP